MLRARSRRKPLGVTLVEVLVVGGIMSGLQSGGHWRYAISKANEIRGMSNLKQIHQLLMIQSMAGGLPKAALYPKGDPKTDPTSILRLIPGAVPKLFTSPFAPEPLRKKVLTYAWNSDLNGKSLDAVKGDTWMLIDMAAFITDPKVPKPSKYLVLYANGSVKSVSQPPADILQAVAEAQKKQQSGAGPEGSDSPGGARKEEEGFDRLPSPARRP